MTREEFIVLAKAMKAVYAGRNFLPDMDSLDIWFEMLKDLDYVRCSAAIKKHMLVNAYPPTIADIREASVTLSDRERKDWSAGWADVMLAIRKYGWCSEKEALASLDPVTSETVRRIGWKTLCESENIAVERASFRTIYQTMEQRRKEDALLPEALKETINALPHGEGQIYTALKPLEGWGMMK